MAKSHLKSSIDWTVALKALADESRLQIIHELLKKEAAVNNLANTLGIKIYNVSKHLRILEASRLVERRKEGNHRIYSITENLKSRLSDDRQILDLGCCKFTFNTDFHEQNRY